MSISQNIFTGALLWRFAQENWNNPHEKYHASCCCTRIDPSAICLCLLCVRLWFLFFIMFSFKNYIQIHRETLYKIFFSSGDLSISQFHRHCCVVFNWSFISSHASNDNVKFDLRFLSCTCCTFHQISFWNTHTHLWHTHTLTHSHKSRSSTRDLVWRVDMRAYTCELDIIFHVGQTLTFAFISAVMTCAICMARMERFQNKSVLSMQQTYIMYKKHPYISRWINKTKIRNKNQWLREVSFSAKNSAVHSGARLLESWKGAQLRVERKQRKFYKGCVTSWSVVSSMAAVMWIALCNLSSGSGIHLDNGCSPPNITGNVVLTKNDLVNFGSWTSWAQNNFQTRKIKVWARLRILIFWSKSSNRESFSAYSERNLQEENKMKTCSAIGDTQVNGWNCNESFIPLTLTFLRKVLWLVWLWDGLWPGKKASEADHQQQQPGGEEEPV